MNIISYLFDKILTNLAQYDNRKKKGILKNTTNQQLESKFMSENMEHIVHRALLKDF